MSVLWEACSIAPAVVMSVGLVLVGFSLTESQQERQGRYQTKISENAEH